MKTPYVLLVAYVALFAGNMLVRGNSTTARTVAAEMQAEPVVAKAPLIKIGNKAAD
jgi:hypothetical protein